MTKRLSFFLFLLLIFPGGLYSQVVITEVMYDLEGSDSGREWVEIVNLSSQTLDISLWKFFENGTNHGLALFQGEINLESSGPK